MNTLKKQMHVTSSQISIKVPKDFIDKDVEIIIKKKNKEIEKELLTNEVKIDTKKWKFKREEIYNA